MPIKRIPSRRPSRPGSRRFSSPLLRRPAGNNAGSTVWLFDLDNTLHDASHAIFPEINTRMTDYTAHVLGSDRETANKMRVDYWKRYGATLLGLIRHHGVDPADFLHRVHDFPELSDMVRVRRGMVARLRALPGRKILLTNAPQAYAHDVLRIAGVDKCFERVIAIEQMWIHGELRPKPDRRMLRRLLARLRIVPGRAVLVEDTVSHLKAYAGVGIRTAWVTGYLRSMTPSFPQSLQAQEAARADSEAARDAAVRTTLAAESRSHADHAAQEHSVTLVAAESQAPVAPATATRARARTHHRPGHVDVKVQYADQLRRRMRRNGS